MIWPAAWPDEAAAATSSLTLHAVVWGGPRPHPEKSFHVGQANSFDPLAGSVTAANRDITATESASAYWDNPHSGSVSLRQSWSLSVVGSYDVMFEDLSYPRMPQFQYSFTSDSRGKLLVNYRVQGADQLSGPGHFDGGLSDFLVSLDYLNAGQRQSYSLTPLEYAVSSQLIFDINPSPDDILSEFLLSIQSWPYAHCQYVCEGVSHSLSQEGRFDWSIVPIPIGPTGVLMSSILILPLLRAAARARRTAA